MASPEKFFDYDFLDDGVGQDIQWVAPQIGGATTVQTLNNSDRAGSGGWEFAWVGGSGSTGLYYGARKPLPAARDLTVKRFLWFSAFSTSYATERLFANLADGGLRLYLTDSNGNYSGYTIYGRDVSNIINNASSFSSYKAVTSDVFSMWWCLDLDRTPDYSSGTLDLTDVVAIEVHIQHAASYIGGIANAPNLALGNLGLTDNLVIRAGEVADPADFTLLPQAFLPTPIAGGNRQGQTLSDIFNGTNGSVYATICPVDVGDGSTATYFRQGRGTLACQLSYEAVEYEISQGRFPNVLPCYISDDNGDRTHTINQSASDDVQFSDFTWSAFDFPAKGYAVEVTGSTSGTCVFLNNTFARAQFVRLRHGTATDSIFDACGYVEINADSAMTGSTIRNAPSGSSALIISGSAGDYSDIDVRLNNPDATHDIALGSGGAGTYNLSGVTVPSGYTLKIHNNSANNITVTIPAGITTSTSTDGGTITLQQPPTTYTIAFPNVIDGSRVQIYNVTTDTIIDSSIVSGGSGYELEMTSGTDYASGNTGRYRISYQSGTTAKEYIEGTFTFTATTTTNSLPLTQSNQASYNGYGVDGSGISGISWDSGNLEIDLNDTDNELAIQQIGAWYYYFITTETGISEAFGAIHWESLNSIQIDVDEVDMKLDNVKAAPLLLNGGRMYRTDGSTIVASTSESIQIDYEPVYTNVISTASPVITGDIDDVPAKVQIGLTSQGYSTSRATNLDNLDTSISSVDTKIDGLSTFDPTTDTVTTDSASREASKADVSGLASQASVDNLQTSVNAIPTTDSVADLTPVLTAIASLNDPTPAEIRAAFDAADFKDKNTEAEIHTWLDSYLNKDDWKDGSVDLQPVIDLINGLNDFDPATDVVARVTLVDTTTTNTDMRGTDGANTTAPDNTAIAAIKERTDNLPDDPASNAKVEESAFL